MAVTRQNVIDVLNGENIKQRLDPKLHDELLNSVKNANDNEFDSNVATSLIVLQTFDLNTSQSVDEETFRWKSEKFIEWLKDPLDLNNSVGDILIKLELLLISFINYKSVPIEICLIQEEPRPLLTEQREQFLSELMDAVLDDIVKKLPDGYDFDWFYQSDVFYEVIYRLRNSNLFQKSSNDIIHTIYSHIHNTLRAKYGLKTLRLAKLLVEQFHSIGSDTIRKHLESFVQTYSKHADFTLKNFFIYKPELKSIFDEHDNKTYSRLFTVYCIKLQKSEPVIPLVSKSTKKTVDDNAAQFRWDQHVSNKARQFNQQINKIDPLRYTCDDDDETVEQSNSTIYLSECQQDEENQYSRNIMKKQHRGRRQNYPAQYKNRNYEPYENRQVSYRENNSRLAYYPREIMYDNKWNG